ncbi:MAG: hypothetical protein FWF63_04725, partial [Fibromonadales bacterium]|nr:hypothetical protein [Fibromonadales bacterium]
MSLYAKTTFNRACTASSKSGFKPSFFSVGKNHFNSQISDSRTVCDAVEGISFSIYDPPPPPP